MNLKNHTSAKINSSDVKEKDNAYQFNIKIDKKFFTNVLLVLLIVLAGFQTWQLLSLKTKISEAKSWQLETDNSGQSQVPASNPNQPSGGGVNSLPSQVGGC